MRCFGMKKQAVVLLLLIITMVILLFYNRPTTSQPIQMWISAQTVGSESEECDMCGSEPLNVKPNQPSSDDSMSLYRLYTQHEAWPEITRDHRQPGQLPGTVHYLWCHNGHLTFQHYLGLLSVLRLLSPVKLIFHYSSLPPIDKEMYHDWFLVLKHSVPSLVLRPLPSPHLPCGSKDLLRQGLALLAKNGGVLIGSNVILTRLPRDLHQRPLWFAFPGDRSDATRGVVIARTGLSDKDMLTILNATDGSCVTPEIYETDIQSGKDTPCVHVPDAPDIYPKDVMHKNSSFAQLARWLYYGKRAPMLPKSIPGSIPRISHVIWFNKAPELPNPLQFYQFLTILSALYVGGLERVYVYGNREFEGQWWQELQKENVTFVYMEDPESVFQQDVKNLAHKSDILRLHILLKYGGVYHDLEATWTQRLPDWLLSYPAVGGSDWTSCGLFPMTLNNGVLLARPGAPWVRHMLEGQRYYQDDQFVWNSVLMAYKTFERHPDQLFFYNHLQVMCDYGICHPSFVKDFKLISIFDRSPQPSFDWRTQAYSLHVTRPDPEKSLASPLALKNGRDIYAEVGQNVLRKSGREHIFTSSG